MRNNGRREMYRSDGDGMRPRPLLGMANLEKRPSLKRGGEEERTIVAKRSPRSPEPVNEDDECEPDYDSSSDSYEPDYDDTVDDLSRKDNRRGISPSKGPGRNSRRGAEDEYGRSVKDEVEEISAHRQAQQPEDRRGSQLVNRRPQPVGMEKQMSAVVGRAMEEARSSSVRVEPGQRGREPDTRREPGREPDTSTGREPGTSTTMRSSGVSTRAPPPATRSSEEIFREAIEHRIRHKNIPIPLSEKRRLMRKMGTQFSVVSHGTDEAPALFRFSLKTFHIPP